MWVYKFPMSVVFCVYVVFVLCFVFCFVLMCFVLFVACFVLCVRLCYMNDLCCFVFV